MNDYTFGKEMNIVEVYEYAEKYFRILPRRFKLYCHEGLIPNCKCFSDSYSKEEFEIVHNRLLLINRIKRSEILSTKDLIDIIKKYPQKINELVERLLKLYREKPTYVYSREVEDIIYCRINDEIMVKVFDKLLNGQDINSINLNDIEKEIENEQSKNR